jgi:hypothetical protein
MPAIAGAMAFICHIIGVSQLSRKKLFAASLSLLINQNP